MSCLSSMDKLLIVFVYRFKMEMIISLSSTVEKVRSRSKINGTKFGCTFTDESVKGLKMFLILNMKINTFLAIFFYGLGRDPLSRYSQR